MTRALILLLVLTASLQAQSYRGEVAAILSRSGCSAGACHGNLNGKGGFKLSLRGEDAAFDHAKLTRDLFGRRVDLAAPDESLLLLKATGKVPHEGGIRFNADSREYGILKAWIAAGCPDDGEKAPKPVSLDVGETSRVLMSPVKSTTITVKAKFNDGSTRDVTHLAAFDLSAVGVGEMHPSGELTREDDGEVVVAVRYLNMQAPVRVAFIPQRSVPDVSLLASSPNTIDTLVAKHLLNLRLKPSVLCTDEVFIRRAYLDCCGVLPTPDAVRKFLSDTTATKREKLIDHLLSRQEYADYWAMKWSDLLRNEEKSLDRKGVQVYHRWIKAWVAEDKPLNEFAREILAARGSTYSNPPANFYRAVRDPYLRAESVAQVFLGVRVGCARCHNHPFDRWTQDDYHRFAAFFPRVQYRVLTNDRKDGLDSHEFVGDQVVYMARSGEVTLPRTNGPAGPKTLGDDVEVKGDADRVSELADWVASPKNPFFARAQANRIWYHLMGRGLVEPNDDFRAANPPSHPELLESLTKDFAANGYRMKPLIKQIMMSRVYQLSSSPNEVNLHDEVNLSHATVMPLEAEQLLDALSRSLGVSARFSGYPRGMRAVAMPAMMQLGRRGDPTMGERFLRVFGKPDRLTTCECERHEDAGLLQAFQLLNGEQINQMLRDSNNKLGKLLDANAKDEEILSELYLAAVSRYPNADEQAKFGKYVKDAKDRRAAWEDVAWSLVNSKEFLLRR
ncbi:DUF1549 domain-containing protein [soil metagenome]